MHVDESRYASDQYERSGKPVNARRMKPDADKAHAQGRASPKYQQASLLDFPHASEQRAGQAADRRCRHQHAIGAR